MHRYARGTRRLDEGWGFRGGVGGWGMGDETNGPTSDVRGEGLGPYVRMCFSLEERGEEEKREEEDKSRFGKLGE